MKPRSAKAKGTRLEKWVVTMLTKAGIRARKQPGSGAFSGFPHDCYADVPGYGPIIVECKNHKNGWRTGDKWLGQGDLLVIKRDYGTPCVYMPWATFEGIIAALAEANEPEENQ